MPTRRKDKKGNIELKPREQIFVEGAVQGKTYTQSALDAGYSPKYAKEIGKQIAKKPHIMAAVQQRIRDVIGADTAEVLGLFATHLRADLADLADFFLEDGSLDLKAAKRAGVSRLVKKMKTRRTPIRGNHGEVVDYATVTEIEIHDSQSAAKTLADIMGIKQMPRANEHDEQKQREWAEAQIARVMRDLGLERGPAIEWMREYTPTAARWIM